MAADTGIDEWLESEGIVDRRSRVEAMVVLAEAGLTRAGKQRMAYVPSEGVDYGRSHQRH